jgi:hypothetical protein
MYQTLFIKTELSREKERFHGENNMEQETTQINMEVEQKKKTPPPDALSVQNHLIKITEAIKENTVALVEMGIVIQKLENKLDVNNQV